MISGLVNSSSALSVVITRPVAALVKSWKCGNGFALFIGTHVHTHTHTHVVGARSALFAHSCAVQSAVSTVHRALPAAAI